MFDLRQSTNGRPLLVGHRGAMDVAPENTMSAFRAGLAGGADILELDVQLTSDKQVIVFHDTDLRLKTPVSGQIAEYKADYLRTLDVGRYFNADFAGERMPFLAEVLAWAKGRIPLMIELKHTPPHFNPELDLCTVALIEKYDMVDEVVVTSFDQFALRRVKRLNPTITTSLIYVGRFCNPLDLITRFEVDVLSPSTDFLCRDEVKMIQAAGYACSPGGFYWDYETLLSWGVDTISSNNPAKVRPLLPEEKPLEAALIAALLA
ncbi:MAG TPA: glycerophosphodiester phosphodiesterase family protein [Chloroflexota bacterium]|nr:glycerophosphodiester phosphodiesterase family protein [Chloroflexota bacterium]